MLCPKIVILTPPPVWLSSFRKYKRSKENTLGCDTKHFISEEFSISRSKYIS
jgi:hypothetical protein